MKLENTGKATLAILLATLIWGMTFAFIKDAVTSTSPCNFLFWRFGMASLIMLVLFFKKIHFTDKKLLLQGIWLGLFLAATVFFQTIGLQYTDASTASFITGLSVVLVTLLVCLFERRWPSLYLVLAVFLTIIGVSFITLSHGMVINRGAIWVLLCAICFAFYIILAGKFSKSEQPITLTFVQLLTIFIITAVLGCVLGKINIPKVGSAWVGIVFCAIFASVIAFLLQLRYQRFVSASKTAIIFAAEPIFATITAALYLDEHLSLKFGIGAVLIFMGMILSEKKMIARNKPIMPQD